MGPSDPLFYPYPSQRTVTYSRQGMVATSQPLAAQAGLEILKKGGNAVDAAIATAACLTVVEPTSNGIGSDAFALIWCNGKLQGLNASGPAPRSISPEKLKKAGIIEIPKYGFIPVTVPGAPGAWGELSRRFGALPLTQVLAPAIDYARKGYPLSPTLAYYWQRAFNIYRQNLLGEEFKPWFETFAPQGRAPQAGEMWRSEDHALTLEGIADTGARSFYQGRLAAEIDRFSRQHQGYIRGEDLADFQPEWVDPISVNYRGYDVWEIPPNGQGLVALMALNILRGFAFSCREDELTFHRQIEAVKLAFADGHKYITDSRSMSLIPGQLLSEQYAAQRRQLIGSEAAQPQAGTPPQGGTVYLAAADGQGNMVSYIQSNYMGFGSGLVVPGTGIALQNRGHNFSLDPRHENVLVPGKRTYHTIIPGFITREGQPVGPFGVMGGFMQPQGHLQVVMNSIDFGLNPQAALDAPRWQWLQDKTVLVEHSFPQAIAAQLSRRGHDIRVALDSGSFGRGQIIWRDPATGVLAGGTEGRADGHIACW